MTRLRQGFGGQAAARIVGRDFEIDPGREPVERDGAGQSPARPTGRPKAPRAERANSAEGLSLERAKSAWGYTPDWVEALAAECDRTSQAKAAGRVGYSASVVNQILSNSYRGQMERVERSVRLALLPEQVRCPVLGVITTTKCAIEQNLPLSIANPLRVALKRACGRCPNREEQK